MTKKTMSWTAKNDQILLLKIIEVHGIAFDHQKIADNWPDAPKRPTPKAVSEHMSKLRRSSKMEEAPRGEAAVSCASSSGGGSTKRKATAPRSRNRNDDTESDGENHLTASEGDDEEEEQTPKARKLGGGRKTPGSSPLKKTLSAAGVKRERSEDTYYTAAQEQPVIEDFAFPETFSGDNYGLDGFDGANDSPFTHVGTPNRMDGTAFNRSLAEMNEMNSFGLPGYANGPIAMPNLSAMPGMSGHPVSPGQYGDMLVAGAQRLTMGQQSSAGFKAPTKIPIPSVRKSAAPAIKAPGPRGSVVKAEADELIGDDIAGPSRERRTMTPRKASAGIGQYLAQEQATKQQLEEPDTDEDSQESVFHDSEDEDDYV